MTDSPAGGGRVALRPLARAARKLGRADGGGAVREPSLEEAEPMKPVPGGTPGRAWLSEWRRLSKSRRRPRGNAAGTTERAWPRVDGLLFIECQGGGDASKWRENRKVVVACETKEGDGLGTNGRGGEWLLRFFFPTLSPGLPAFHFLSLHTLSILLSSVLHAAHPGISLSEFTLPTFKCNSARL